MNDIGTGQTLDGKLFSWENHHGVAEASTLRFGVDGHAPSVLNIRSHRTGRVKRFRLLGLEKRPEGDVASWCYESKGILITVFND